MSRSKAKKLRDDVTERFLSIGIDVVAWRNLPTDQRARFWLGMGYLVLVRQAPGTPDNLNSLVVLPGKIPPQFIS